jgi:hypothetical protein
MLYVGAGAGHIALELARSGHDVAAKRVLQRLTWHPYLFRDLAAEMRVPAEQEADVAVCLPNQEAALLAQRRLQGVLFSTTGERRTAV